MREGVRRGYRVDEGRRDKGMRRRVDEAGRGEGRRGVATTLYMCISYSVLCMTASRLHHTCQGLPTMYCEVWGQKVKGT